MLRKTIKNIAVLDLQNFTAEALRGIKKIDGCAIVLISKNASDEWKNAYANIKSCRAMCPTALLYRDVY